MSLFDLFKRKKKVVLSKEELKWNKIWELWTESKVASPYAELMTYQSEINNGGHSQYFTNVQNTGDLPKEMSALEQILSVELKNNLQKAYEAYLILKKIAKMRWQKKFWNGVTNFFMSKNPKSLVY